MCTLQKPEGLPYVFSDFPKQFAAGFKGKGHEVSCSAMHPPTS
jgi:hypothetical protein